MPVAVSYLPLVCRDGERAQSELVQRGLLGLLPSPALGSMVLSQLVLLSSQLGPGHPTAPLERILGPNQFYLQAKLILPMAGTPACGKHALAICRCSDEDAGARHKQQQL